MYNKDLLRFFILNIFLCASLCCAKAENAFCFEPPRYEIQATIDSTQKTIQATETVTFTNNSKAPTDEIIFHIYPNRKFTDREKAFMARFSGYFKVNFFPEGFQSGSMRIDSVSRVGGKVTFAVEGDDQTLLRIPLNQKLNPGESIQLTIDFNVEIPHSYGRFGWNEHIIALSRWYPVLSVLTDDGWNKNPFYPYHRPFFSDASQYNVSLTVGSDTIVIHSGDLQSEVSQTPGVKTLRIGTKYPIREFSLALSPDYKVIEENLDGVKIKSFYLAGDEFHAREALKSATDLMKYYSSRFGPYPYQEFSIAPVYLGYGGEQMSNLVFIDTRVYQLPKLLLRYLDFLVSHETGHQWFYNLVGVDEFSQMWLEEGVNSYFNLQYLEAKYGKDATVVVLPKALEWVLPNFSFARARDYRYKLIARTDLDHSVTGKLSSFVEPLSIFSITYGKGSAIVSMLNYLLGDGDFNKVTTRIFKEFRFKNFDTDQLVELCRQESGQDLEEFFHEWLQTTEKFDYSVRAVKGSKVTLQNRGDIAMPAEVEIKTADGRTEKMVWEGDPKETKEIEVAGVGRIRQVKIDPRGRILDIDRTNNAWPRTVHFKLVPLYTGLYDIPIFLPDDGYNVVIGPEFANSGIGLKASVQKPYDQNVYAASDYNFNDALVQSRLGYQLNNVFHTMMTAGVELFNTTDLDGGEEDLAGGKIFLRKELWPASYGLTEINDHVTLYLLRDRSLNKGFSLGGAEDSRNVSYLRKDEAIVGTTLHIGRYGPYPDPSQGYKTDTLVESSNHFLGATQYFYRASEDVSFYHPVTPKTKLALRLKYGWGYPDDKNLYELGGADGLRGYGRKTLRGSNAALASLEYRFPIMEKLNIRLLDNFLGFESWGGVVFVDVGQSWFDNIGDSKLKKDAGLGLTLTTTAASFLEKVIIRLDVAQAINEPKTDPHFWFRVGQAF
ncbi:MAG TPA: M1 family aminopeptidase [Candidatus Omnitrophota bacterium]|nr:M1 family aminopeptidase [Candidatus Omnitrophota bacterium]HPD84476.1 M1 family aminopeptidase [Candidatus Omnitrophota bacterium]HRZ03334.1 M1 family aminopeptidase [Candidatus Omnitrophota bacterium]